jgi:hypothetical protein
MKLQNLIRRFDLRAYLEKVPMLAEMPQGEIALHVSKTIGVPVSRWSVSRALASDGLLVYRSKKNQRNVTDDHVSRFVSLYHSLFCVRRFLPDVSIPDNAEPANIFDKKTKETKSFFPAKIGAIEGTVDAKLVRTENQIKTRNVKVDGKTIYANHAIATMRIEDIKQRTKTNKAGKAIYENKNITTQLTVKEGTELIPIEEQYRIAKRIYIGETGIILKKGPVYRYIESYLFKMQYAIGQRKNTSRGIFVPSVRLNDVLQDLALDLWEYIRNDGALDDEKIKATMLAAVPKRILAIQRDNRNTLLLGDAELIHNANGTFSVLQPMEDEIE